jgi:hypothetical protein
MGTEISSAIMMNNNADSSEKLKKDLSYDAAILLLVHTQSKMKSVTSISMFIAALFTTDKESNEVPINE